jgi:hypothetical protein
VYERRSTGSDVVGLLASDTLSAVALSGRHMAVGTRGGVVALLDTSAKLVRHPELLCPDAPLTLAPTLSRRRSTQVRQFPALRGVINDVGFDADGAFVVAGCEDGSVSVRTHAQPHRQVARAAHSVAHSALTHLDYSPVAHQVSSVVGDDRAVFSHGTAVKVCFATLLPVLCLLTRILVLHCHRVCH